MDKYRIVVVALSGGAYPNQVYDYEAIRVSPNIYTTIEEIDSFVMAMEDAAKNGVVASRVPSRRAVVDELNELALG